MDKVLPSVIGGALVGYVSDWAPRFSGLSTQECAEGEVPGTWNAVGDFIETGLKDATGWIPIIGGTVELGTLIANETTFKRGLVPALVGAGLGIVSSVIDQPSLVFGAIGAGVANSMYFNPGRADEVDLGCGPPSSFEQGVLNTDDIAGQMYVDGDIFNAWFELGIGTLISPFLGEESGVIAETFIDAVEGPPEFIVENTAEVGSLVSNITVEGFEGMFNAVTGGAYEPEYSQAAQDYQITPGGYCNKKDTDPDGNSVYSNGTTVNDLVKQMYNPPGDNTKYACVKSDGKGVTNSDPDGTWQAVKKNWAGVCYVPGNCKSCNNVCKW